MPSRPVEVINKKWHLSTEMDPTILKDSVVSVATGVVVVVDVVVVEAVVVEILSSLPNNGISLTEGRVDKGIGRPVVTPTKSLHNMYFS